MENVDAKNTKRYTTTTVKLFRDYLTFKGERADFENLTCEKLDEMSGKFYVEVRTKYGDSCIVVIFSMKNNITNVAFLFGTICRYIDLREKHIDLALRARSICFSLKSIYLQIDLIQRLYLYNMSLRY